MLFLFVYLINLYVRPQDWLPLFYAWPVDYLVMVPALLYAYMTRSSDGQQLVRLPQYALMTALLIIVFLSNAVNGNIGFGADEFVLFFKKACIFLLVLLLVRSVRDLKNTLSVIVILSSLIAVQSLVQFIAGGTGIAGQDFYHSGVGTRTKWVGLWNGSNVLSLLFNTAVPLALEFSFGPYPLSSRVVNICCTAVLIGGVYTTNSRGGFVTLLAVLFLYPLFRMKKRKTAAIIGAAMAGLALVYLAPTRATEMNTSEESAYIRTRLWSAAMDMFKENPVLGIGKGRFIKESGRHMMTHSNFMQNLSEMGGAGIFVWVGLIYVSFCSLYRIQKDAGGPSWRETMLRSAARALMISLIGFNVCTLFVTMDIDIFYLLLGLCAAAINVMHSRVRPVRLGFGFKDVRNISALIVCLLLYYHLYTR